MIKVMGKKKEVEKKFKVHTLSGIFDKYNEMEVELALVSISDWKKSFAWVPLGALEVTENEMKSSAESVEKVREKIINLVRSKAYHLKEELEDELGELKDIVGVYSEIQKQMESTTEKYFKNLDELKDWFFRVLEFIELYVYYEFVNETYDSDVSKVLYSQYLGTLKVRDSIDSSDFSEDDYRPSLYVEDLYTTYVSILRDYRGMHRKRYEMIAQRISSL